MIPRKKKKLVGELVVVVVVTYEAEVGGVGVDVSPGHLGLALLPDAPAGLVEDGRGSRRALHLVVDRDGERRRRLAVVAAAGGVEAVAPDALPGRRGGRAALRRGGLAVVAGGHHVVDLALQLGVLCHDRPQHLAEPPVLLAHSPELRLQRLDLLLRPTKSQLANRSRDRTHSCPRFERAAACAHAPITSRSFLTARKFSSTRTLVAAGATGCAVGRPTLRSRLRDGCPPIHGSMAAAAAVVATRTATPSIAFRTTASRTCCYSYSRQRRPTTGSWMRREDLVDGGRACAVKLCMRGPWPGGAAIYRQREGEATCVLAVWWGEAGSPGDGRRSISRGPCRPSSSRSWQNISKLERRSRMVSAPRMPVTVEPGTD
jgi:hypothetical protein